MLFSLMKIKTLLGELNFWYEAPGVDSVYKISSVSNLDAGVKAILFNKDLTLSLQVTEYPKKQHPLW